MKIKFPIKISVYQAMQYAKGFPLTEGGPFTIS
jgi:hypothetical protein